MVLLIKNIRQLIQILEPEIQWVAGNNMSHLNLIENAWLSIRDGLIDDFGRMDSGIPDAEELIDASGKIVMPAFCNSSASFPGSPKATLTVKSDFGKAVARS